MLKQGKAPARAGAGDRIKPGKLLSNPPYYTPIRPRKQSIRNLSAMLDQALYLAEYHSDLADFHRCQAQKHRKVLQALQGLIPRPQLKTEGDLFNG